MLVNLTRPLSVEADTHDRDLADPLTTARTTIALQAAALTELERSLNGAFTLAVERMARCEGRVIVSGIGKSGHIGQKMAATLASTGTPAFFVHTAEAGHGDLGMIGRNDIVLALSNSGESAEFRPLLQYCRRFQVALIAITANPASSLGRYADLILPLPRTDESCPLSLAPMTSTTLTLVLGDALAAALIRAKGFRREDFAKFHPSGRLGAQLMRLSEILDQQPDLRAVPSVDIDAKVVDVIASITSGRRGTTAVTENGQVVGVITDGDLRRALANTRLFERAAGELMSVNPLRIAADKLAVDALGMFERYRVGALFVTEPGDPGAVVGLVELKDLISLGIA